uniref:Acrosin n=1 Tax=Pavo cristatus TaxID=9049 RepID=A0A8C9FM59_PAVCR
MGCCSPPGAMVLLLPLVVLLAACRPGHGYSSNCDYVLESRVVIGANDLTHLGQEVEVHTIRRAILHEYFNNKTMINDIALLELDRPVHCSYYIQLACVPDASLRVSELTDCYVSGWGHMGMRSAAPVQTAEVLQEAKVHLLNLNLCNSSHWYAGVLHTHNVCAGYPQGGIDTCQGDSGGPLMCKDKTADYFWLIGVTSWGRGCGRIQQPGVYASTQYFRNWILVQMGLLPAEAPTSTPYPVYVSTSYQRPKPTYSSPFRPCPFPRQKVLDFFNLLQELLQGLRGKKA